MPGLRNGDGKVADLISAELATQIRDTDLFIAVGQANADLSTWPVLRMVKGKTICVLNKCDEGADPEVFMAPTLSNGRLRHLRSYPYTQLVGQCAFVIAREPREKERTALTKQLPFLANNETADLPGVEILVGCEAVRNFIIGFYKALLRQRMPEIRATLENLYQDLRQVVEQHDRAAPSISPANFVSSVYDSVVPFMFQGLRRLKATASDQLRSDYNSQYVDTLLQDNPDFLDNILADGMVDADIRVPGTEGLYPCLEYAYSMIGRKITEDSAKFFTETFQRIRDAAIKLLDEHASREPRHSKVIEGCKTAIMRTASEDVFNEAVKGLAELLQAPPHSSYPYDTNFHAKNVISELKQALRTLDASGNGQKIMAQLEQYGFIARLEELQRRRGGLRDNIEHCIRWYWASIPGMGEEQHSTGGYSDDMVKKQLRALTAYFELLDLALRQQRAIMVDTATDYVVDADAEEQRTIERYRKAVRDILTWFGGSVPSQGTRQERLQVPRTRQISSYHLK